MKISMKQLVKNAVELLLAAIYGFVAIYLINTGFSEKNWYLGAAYFLVGLVMLCIGGAVVHQMEDGGKYK